MARCLENIGIELISWKAKLREKGGWLSICVLCFRSPLEKKGTRKNENKKKKNTVKMEKRGIKCLLLKVSGVRGLQLN